MNDSSSLVVNGIPHDLPPEWRGRRLVDLLRVRLGLTGTKEGCSEGDCGACTVLLDDEPVCSCLMLCGLVGTRTVTTVEGLPTGYLNRFVDATDDLGGVQCGFCTPGFLVMGYWLACGGGNDGPEQDPGQLAGNICRCTGYQQLSEVLAGIR